jgi:hypothetical protein
MRGRSLLWAGPGVLLLGGRAAEPSAIVAEEDEGLDVAAVEDRLVAVPATAGDPLAASELGEAAPAPSEASRRRR